MKKFFLLLILVLPIISALQITEVELNPLGSDSGQEWIEFYSEDSINLSDFKILNNDQQELSLFGNYSGYFIWIFDSQWLDNSDEKIYLYQEQQLIQETILFEDLKNNEFSFQFCDDSWLFKESTSNKENTCPKKQEPEIIEEPKEQEKEIENKTLPQRNFSIQKEVNNSPPEIIYLNPQTIKTLENFPKQEQDKKPIIFFIGFCILLAILYFVQLKGKNKNEFRK